MNEKEIKIVQEYLDKKHKEIMQTPIVDDKRKKIAFLTYLYDEVTHELEK